MHFFENTWTGTSEPFQHTLQEYYRAMERLSLILLQILELSLTLPRGYLGDHMYRHTSILTANHYPTLNDYRCPEQHTGTASPYDPVQNADRVNPDSAHGTPSQAISPHVTSSQAISPHNPPSQAISTHSTPSQAISPHGPPFQAISTHNPPSQAISTHNTPSQAISLHNPPISQVRVAEHTDVSMLTIVATSAPGLEIYEKSSATYQPVAHVPGVCVDGHIFNTRSISLHHTLPYSNVSSKRSSHLFSNIPYTFFYLFRCTGALVVNIGDCLRDWSGGRLVSTKHRVVLPVVQNTGATNERGCSLQSPDRAHSIDPVNNTDTARVVGSQRLSLAYFVAPNHDTLLHPFPTPPHPLLLEPGQINGTVNSNDQVQNAGTTREKENGCSLQNGDTANPVDPASLPVPVCVPPGVQVLLTFAQWRKRRIATAMKR